MDKIFPCCFHRSNTNVTSPTVVGSQSVVPSTTPQPTDIPESSSAASIKSIQKSIQEENTPEHIDNLIKILDDVLSKIKGEGEEVAASTGVESLASTTRTASEVLDFVSSEAKNFSELEISKELGRVATRVVDAIAGTHFIFLGLSLVAHTVERFLKMGTTHSACKKFLEELIELAKEVKKFKEAVPDESWKVCKAMFEIVVGARICCDYIDGGRASRYWKVDVMESQLQKTKEIIRDLRASLTLLTATHIARGLSDIGHQIPRHTMPCPSEPRGLSLEPEGIEEVKKLLNIEGSEQAIAVVIVGIGGIGKSTLATSVIKSLNLPSTDFMYSNVTIDHKTPDKRSHIAKLQSDIIHHFTGDVQHVQDPEQGQYKLQQSMKNKFCFLYIDNVVDTFSIKELLPQSPSQEKSEEQPEASYTEKMSAKSSQNQIQKTKIRILITSRQKDLKPMLNTIVFEHQVRELSRDRAIKFLTTTIIQAEKPAYDLDGFHEEGKINELAEACHGVPLLLSIFGNHLKDNRDKVSYERAIKALKEGDLDRYSRGDEDLLSKKLMFVFDQMKDEEAQEAFLDICSYFQGWRWDLVANIFESETLDILQKKKLVNKSEADTVIVHDILLLMGAKKAKDTRLQNYEEFFHINDDESKLRSVKGMALLDSTFVATLETRHLNLMRHSLRILRLGDWVRVDGPPCDRAFKQLRYLYVGDLKHFPFKDISKMEKLNDFWNCSKSGMELAQLPPSLKRLIQNIPYQDCNEFSRLPLKNLKSLKRFNIQTKKSVRLPQGFKLPASLEHLTLIGCEQLPERFGHLSALQTLFLNKCDLKCLPQELARSVQLTSLRLQNCTNLISLPDNIFASLCSLRVLNLRGCTRLENLPADLGMLTALQNLDIGECENLKVLPENFGGLKSLKTLGLDGCISLQKLPDSFGMLRIEHLTLQSLACLKELPHSIGDLACLKSLTLKSCHSLEFVPESLAHLTNLDTLEVEDCIKLGSLPKTFEQFRCLKKIVLSDCPLLSRLPDGLEALETLKCMKLIYCKSLVDFPSCFEMLSCLEELHLHGLFFSSLPEGLGKLKKLKILCIFGCSKFQTLPQDFKNVATSNYLGLSLCETLEGTTMDKIVKLQNCHYVDISGSGKLIERWNELKEEDTNLPMIVQTSRNWEDNGNEWDRARRVGLFCGECIHLDSATQELKYHSSLSIPNNTTIALISLHNDQPQPLQPTLDMAMERARANCAGQLTIIYVCRRSDDSDAPNQEDETEKIRQRLMLLPQGISYAIPSTDIRRLSLIGQAIFNSPYVFNEGSGPKLLCFMVDVKEDDQGRQILKDGICVAEDEISKKSRERLPISENSDEEIENSDKIVEFINCICESKTQRPPGQCSGLPEENMLEQLIQKLKIKDFNHFSDMKVNVDHLQGKTVAIILIDQNYPECIRLQLIYHDIKLKDPNFEAIWIPLLEEEDFGFGTYSRAIKCMPWLTLADPKLIKIADIKDKNPRVIIINSGGSMGSPNALSLLMSWGVDAYPFTKGILSQLELKSSLETLFHSTEIKWQELNNKVIFLYAEPPSQKLKMKSTLEKLVQIRGKDNFEIVYVGRFFGERNVAEILPKAYEDATQSMDWSKLPFEDMMTFWYRCKYLSDEEVQQQEPISASTLKRIVKALVNEERWLVVLDGDGVVTTHGTDVVEIACELIDEKDDEVDIMMKEKLRQSLREGKCGEGLRRYFRDELSHPQHHHPLRIPRKEWSSLRCDNCYLQRVYKRYGRRIYRCDECDWDLCWDCWKEFVKEEVRSNATQES